MSLRLLVDECLCDKRFVSALKEAGHDVFTVNESGMHGKTDDAVFEFAIGQDRIVITANCSDFQELAAVRLSKGEHHPGILCIFLYNNPHKDMSNTARVKSINNMEKTGVAVHDTVIVLNKYNY